jgi:hypothetical protein
MKYLGCTLTATVALGLTLGCSGSSTPKGGAGGASGNASAAGSGTSAGGSAMSAGGSTSVAGTGASSGGIPDTPSGPTTAAEEAKKLGRPANFMVGMGNDLNNDHSMDGAYTLGTTLDLHYAYMVELSTKGGWPTWNPNGSFVNVLTDSADAKGVVPMFTMYEMASDGDGNLAGLSDDAFMTAYWSDMKLLFQRLAMFGKPAVVHLEPDFWAYAEQKAKEDPTSVPVKVTPDAPDCGGLSNDLVGLGHCLVRLARLYAPKALIGFHASQWSNADPNATVKFLNAVGADQGDVVFADLLDRDAGCFEAAVDPNCMRGGTFYWDETNATSPNFHDYLAWSKTISTGIGHPLIWWQIPFGVPSTTKGGTAGHYRDNRVHYIFSHIAEFVAAGGLAVTFGTGAANQTYITTDGDQFKNAVAAYYKAPVALP